MGLGDFFGGGADAPDPIDPLKLGRQTGKLQTQFQGQRQKLRKQFDPQIMQGALRQAGRAQTGLSSLGQNITGDISRDRASLTGGDIGTLRQQSQGFAGAERLQEMLQRQAEDQLQRAGALTKEQFRDVDQGVFGGLAGQGRGVGAFGAVQSALGRQSAIRADEDRARQFAQQTQQGGLAVSNPLQNILAQSSNATGTFMDRLRNIQGFGAQNQVNFDPINANVSNIAQFNNQMQQQQAQASAGGFGDIIGGLGSLAGTVMGGPLGGMIGGKIGGMFGGGSSGGGGVASFAGAGDMASGQHGPLPQGGDFFGLPR